MDTTIVLSSDLYEEFFKCITNLRDVCTDIIIKNSIIRQRTDDKNTLFEIDLNDLFGEEISFAISYFKDRYDLFKMFSGKEVTLKIHRDEEDPEGSSWYEISDNLSRIRFDFPDEDFLQNEFVTDEELDAIVTCTDDDLILETTIEKTITERIKTVTSTFESHFIKMDFEGSMVSIGSIDPTKTNRVFFLENLPIEMEFDTKHYANITRVPFYINHDTAYSFKLFKQPDEMITQNVINTSIGAIPISMYCKSTIIEENE